MRSAPVSVTVVIGGEKISLRPSLRVAMRLHAMGYANLVGAISEGNLGVMVELISHHTDIPDLPRKVWEMGVESLITPLTAYVLNCTGVDPSEAVAEGERIPFEEYHDQLYRIATGWLGWTPDTAWNASPEEIIQAHKGRVEMLGALFGGGGNQPAEQKPASLDDKFRLAFAGMGTRVVRRKKQED